MGAMLNYAYIVTLGQVTRAAISMGLDACHGFLHSPKRGRLSLSYDLMEFHRTAITERVFEIAGKRTWQQSDFELDPLGIVRLTSDLAREIAATALRITPARGNFGRSGTNADDVAQNLASGDGLFLKWLGISLKLTPGPRPMAVRRHVEHGRARNERES
jgi:hypothetical protein